MFRHVLTSFTKVGFHDDDILLQGEKKEDNVMAVACGLSRLP